jgi:hypothetical protein
LRCLHEFFDIGLKEKEPFSNPTSYPMTAGEFFQASIRNSGEVFEQFFERDGGFRHRCPLVPFKRPSSLLSFSHLPHPAETNLVNLPNHQD